jgi:hypothetical protein
VTDRDAIEAGDTHATSPNNSIQSVAHDIRYSIASVGSLNSISASSAATIRP